MAEGGDAGRRGPGAGDAEAAPKVFPGLEAEARQRLCSVGRNLHDSALIGGRAGNLSVRLGGGRLLVSPAGAHKGHLAPADLVVVSAQGADAEADARATSELPFHRAAYRARPDAAALVHTHAPALTAAGLRGIDVTGLFPEIEEALGTVAVVPFRPSGSGALAEAVARAARRADVLLLARHGVVTLGATPEDARDRTELAELTAWAALLASEAGLGLDLRRVAELHGRLARRGRRPAAGEGEG